MKARHRIMPELALLALSLSFIQMATAQATNWANTGSLNTARYEHTATLLPNGMVLVAGGSNGSNSLANAELYNPATGTWTVTGSLNTGRYGHTATLLPNGQVLVAGGYNGSSTLTSAELYNPATGTWTTTGSLSIARCYHTATLLPNGMVLVAAGAGNSGLLSSAELYNPTTGTWTATGSLNNARYLHTATLLPNGQVLVAGGYNGSSVLTSAELYNPASGTWTTKGSLGTARYEHTATLLPNGQVLVAGGSNGSNSLANAELYNPASGTWTNTGSLNNAHYLHTATLLPNGQVLVAGGYSAELYNPASGTWTNTGSLNTARFIHTATLLPNGQVLVAGGYGNGGPTNSAELYNPASRTWTTTGSLNAARFLHTATLLPNGQVLVAGSYGNSGETNSTELYNPASGTWTTTGSLNTARCYHTATLLPNGQVLVAGGDTVGNSAELYNPASGMWTMTGSLNAARYEHTATLLSNGQVLVAGGVGNSGIFSGAELYDPASGTWTNTGSLNTARCYHTATLLPNGQVLVAGGYGRSGWLTSAELYNPTTGTWTNTGSLNTGRCLHTATLLPNGQVLVAGGHGSSGWLTEAELYNPASGTWTNTGSLNTARCHHTATLLPNGQVLVAGGYGADNSVELYNPASGTWTSTGSLNIARSYHTATLLPNGQVLVAGGWNGSSILTNAELYDVGLGFNPAWQPQIATFTSPLANNGCLALTGSQFRGISEGSGGDTWDSAADYPVVQLLSLGNEQTLFLLSTNWSTNLWTSAAVTNWPPGWALATVFVNGIPSTAILLCPQVAAPAATTQPATGIGLTTATLNSAVTPNGLPTSAWFNWGTTTNYGASTGPAGIGSGTSPVPFNASLVGLTPLTTYHFQAVAANSAGTNYGADLAFIATTNNNANLIALTLSAGVLTPAFASNITSYTVSLTYVSNSSVTVTPTSADPNATIQVNANGGPWTNVASGTPSSPFTLVLGLTTLQVQVTAQNGVTIQTYSIAITSMAAPAATTQPATGVGNTTATLNGTVTPNDLPTIAWFNWGTTTNYGASTVPASVGSGTSPVTTNASLAGLNPLTTYHFQAVAANGAGTNYGADLAFTTLAPGISTVDWGNVHQRIDGFGACSAWQSYWSTDQADLLFSTNNGIVYTDYLGVVTTNNGIGLSLLRNHIYPAGSTSSNDAPYTSETNIMQMAQARGARVWSTPWTPAAGFKTPAQTNGGNFLSYTTNLQNYASQLANYVVSMEQNYGVTIYAISVQNEPDNITTQYESCGWNGSQIELFVPYLRSALVAAGVGSTQIIIPESEHWSSDTALFAQTLNDPTTVTDVDIIADHNYDGPDQQHGDTSTPAKLSVKGKTVWETEVSVADNYDGSISNGLYWAKRIYLFLTAAQVNAWHYWRLIGATSLNGGLTDFYGEPAKRMFVLGQWSRFVRPGYYRIDATNTGNILISAFDDTNSGNFVIVAVNNAGGSINQTFNLTNLPGRVSSVTPWITSATNSLANLAPVSVSGSSFTYLLPAQSVVTFVGQSVAVTSSNIVISSTACLPGRSAFVLTWNATAGAYYSVLKTNVLSGFSTNWPAIVTGYPTGGAAGGPLSYTDTTATVGPAFYQVRSP